MRYYYGGPEGWSWYPVFWLIMLLVFVGLVFLLISLFLRRPIRHLVAPDREPPMKATDAFAILDERLARGEIDVQEYNERKEALKKHKEE